MPLKYNATETQKQQHALEDRVLKLYKTLLIDRVNGSLEPSQLELLRVDHVKYLYNGLRQLSPGFAGLDASRPWIMFWVLHSLALLEAPYPDFFVPDDAVAFLQLCQHPEGGYGGGPQQLAHLATTYAAVAALVTLGTDAALASIDRDAMLGFLRCMCVGSERGGGFTIHEGGEVDVRACYTALAVAHMLNLDMADLVQRSGAVEYLLACQTYEGGMGGEPHNEAHGGYAFCALAGLILAGAAERVDLPRLLQWAAHRQGTVEGGFNGRTNKLVDGCYSYWQGALFSLLHHLPPPLLSRHTPPSSAPSSPSPQQPHSSARSAPSPTDPSPGSEAAGSSAAGDGTGGSRTGAADGAGDSDDDDDSLGGLWDEQEVPDVPDVGLALASVGPRRPPTPSSVFEAAALCPAAAPAPSPTSTSQPPAAVTPAAASASAPAATAPLAASTSADLCNGAALQLWLLRSCQNTQGGLRDKPGKSVDFYHTCYCLSGLTAVQHRGEVMGPPANLLARADPVVNVLATKLRAARQHWGAAEPAVSSP